MRTSTQERPAGYCLKEQDELIEVKATDNTKDIFLITKKGSASGSMRQMYV